MAKMKRDKYIQIMVSNELNDRFNAIVESEGKLKIRVGQEMVKEFVERKEKDFANGD